jgi:hypothetical protein
VLKGDVKYSDVCMVGLVCGVVLPDDGGGRHQNMSEYSLTV